MQPKPDFHSSWIGRASGLAIVALASSLGGRHAAAQQQVWATQVGTSATDWASGLASDGAGGTFACGGTQGPMWGPYLGGGDGWLARFDAAGNALWGKQFGAAGSHMDVANDVEAGPAGGVFVCGTTRSKLGASWIGSTDGWVGHFDANGTMIWLTQLGTLDEDELEAVVPHPDGGVYAAGRTRGATGEPSFGGYDTWVARLSGTGQVLWQQHYGTVADDWTRAAALDGIGGLYVCGSTFGHWGAANTGGHDAWVARIDAAGHQQWVLQNGLHGNDYWWDMRTDGAGGVFLGGYVSFTPAGGVIARLGSTGEFAWIKPITTHSFAGVSQIALDGTGGLYVCGDPSQEYGGVFYGMSDAYITRLDGDGNELWIHVLGTPSSDAANSITSDGSGGVIVGGHSKGDLGGPNAGSDDVWLARFDGSCGIGPSHCSPSLTSIPDCQSQLTASGSPRVSFPGEFTISSGSVPGGNLGICLIGANGPASIPFGTLGGVLCVQAPFFRTPPKVSGGLSGQCDGIYNFLLLELVNASPVVVAGNTLHAQVWARDPANPDGFLLSDGIEFTVCP
jgi:hypothetical protein